MQRKTIRATVGATDVDIPIHTFLPNQFLYYESGAITTHVAAKIVGSPITGNLAAWFNVETLVDSGVTLADVVTTTATPTAGQVPAFTGVGKVVAPTTVTIVGGAVSNVATLDGRDPTTFVTGPASSSFNSLAAFNNTTGKSILDTSIDANRVVMTVSSSSIGDNIATFFSTSGKVIYDAGVSLSNIVTSTSTPSANQVATFTGTGKAIQNSTVTIVGGVISNVTSINGTNIGDFVTGPSSAIADRVASFNGTTGKIIKDSGLPAARVVTGPASSTNGEIAAFNGPTGNVVQSTGVLAASVVVGPSSSVNNRIAAFNGTTGKLILDGGILVTDVVRGPASATTDRVAVFSGTSGKLIVDAALIYTDIVTGPTSAVSGDIATFNGTTGKLLQDSGVPTANIVTTTATPTAGQVATFTGSGKAAAPVTVTIAGGAISNVTTIDGVDITAHALRHLPAGADSLFTSTGWVTNADVPVYSGSGIVFAPCRFLAKVVAGNTISSSLSVVHSTAAIGRAGNYVVEWNFLVTTDGSAGTFTINITWGSATGVAVSSLDPVTATVQTTSGANANATIPSGSSAFCIRTRLGITGISATDSISYAVAWSATPCTLAANGTFLMIESK
jgi:hypothetical protein